MDHILPHPIWRHEWRDRLRHVDVAACVAIGLLFAINSTQTIGLAALGYPVTASDISEGELAEAEKIRKDVLF